MTYSEAAVLWLAFVSAHAGGMAAGTYPKPVWRLYGITALFGVLLAGYFGGRYA